MTRSIEDGFNQLPHLGINEKQARKPRSYASPKLCPPTYLLTHLLTGVKCRATSVAKNDVYSDMQKCRDCRHAETDPYICMLVIYIVINPIWMSSVCDTGIYFSSLPILMHVAWMIQVHRFKHGFFEVVSASH